MNIAIIGRTKALYDTTKLLLSQGHEIKIIITATESPEYKIRAIDFESLAESINAKFMKTARINKPEHIELIKSCRNINIGISMNYVGIISQDVIDLFPFGILNSHAGDLPRYRGNACQAWAIINGESNIGLCIHRMVGNELDSGDIIAREYQSIDINTKIGDVYSWISERVPSLFLKSIDYLQQDKHFVLERQSTNLKHIMRCYPRLPEDARINWKNSNVEILRLINASGEPYNGAFCEYEGEKLVIWDAELYEDEENYCAVPGQIAKINRSDGAIVVIAQQGKLKLKEVSYRGKRQRPCDIITSIRKRLK